MSNQQNDHDDGLVHGHRWAKEPTPAHVRPAPPTTRPVTPEHDDGLVHDHGWACAERGRMAGPR